MDVNSLRPVNSMLTDAFFAKVLNVFVLFETLHRLPVTGSAFSQRKSRPLGEG